MSVETITLGGGCFWCLEAIYQLVVGVLKVESGYAGGHTLNPNYEMVCTGETGHAEVVQIQFDTEQITCREILEIFFVMHDPTTLNQQGNDRGTQYRSVIFTHIEEQKILAQQIADEMANVWNALIVTQILTLENYYRAEVYHQDYFNQHANQGYCAFVIAPKLAHFRGIFAHKMRH